ncbi:FecR domain-containing protein [Dongia sp.]|uniref:FecR family protein n=1 Tax=Dongia sp. TaxID=1977262 RepID=UPI0035AFABD8
MRRSRWMATLCSTLALLAPLPAAAEIGTPAGIAGAVSGEVDLVSPARSGPAPVAVASGDGLLMGDALSTSADSRLQIMLLDESAITLGPRAQLTIDEFVYDPAKTDGNLLNASLASGAFRLVTGAIARGNPEGTTVALPNAVLTVRGTTVLGACNGSCVVALAGTGAENNVGKRPSSVTLHSPKGDVVLKRAGFYVEIGPDGSLSEPRELTDAVERRFAEIFVPAGGASGTGGNRATGTDILRQSGQPTQDGRLLAVDQRNFEDADPINDGGLIDASMNMPIGTINYASGAIPFAGASGDGDYYLTYSLDLAARSFDGTVKIDHTDEGFVTQFPLLHDPFTQGLSLHETGTVPGAQLFSSPNPNATFDFTYTITPNNISSTLIYDQDGAGTAPGSSGSGNAPVVP